MRSVASPGRENERIFRAVSRGAAAWTQAINLRGRHRFLVPVERADDAEVALRYVAARLDPSVAAVHLVNVQPALDIARSTSQDGAPAGFDARRHPTADPLLDHVRRSAPAGAPRITTEVAYGSPAERLCAIAQPQRFSGIIIGRRSCVLDDFIGRSTIAKILQLARVPVTIVQNPARASGAREQATRARALRSQSQACEPIPG